MNMTTADRETRAARAEARAARRHENRKRGYAVARLLRCPACRKGNALGKPATWGDTTARKCRYCGHWEKQS